MSASETAPSPESTRADSPRAYPSRGYPKRPLGLRDYEKGRDAWLGEQTLKAVMAATGASHDAARRLVYSGVPALGLPPLSHEARLVAALSEEITE